MNRSRLVRSDVAAAASVALLAGCSGGLAPGDAAQVGDRTLSRAQVDDAAEGFCLAIAEQLEANGQQLANLQLRQRIVQYMSLRLVGENLAEEYDVEPGAAYQDARSQVEGLLGAVPEELHSAVVDFETTEQYLQSVTTAVGAAVLAEEGVSDVSEEEAAARGQEVFGEAAAGADWQLDARYGLVAGELGVEVGDALSSQAVSFPALQGVAVPETGAVEPSPDWIMALPSSQRCG